MMNYCGFEVIGGGINQLWNGFPWNLLTQIT